MKEIMNTEVVVNAEAFAIATQMYVRLRRVCSRVIDVMYMVHDKQYARHIVEIALATQDTELSHYVARLTYLLDLYPEPEPTFVAEAIQQPALKAEEEYVIEVTEDEIYRAQVHHHYIGALR